MMKKSNVGFTLIELLIYVTIFALVAGFFTSILLITLRVQGTQAGTVEVSSQLNFAMQTIQRNIRESSAITAPGPGSAGSTLSVTGGPSGAITIALGTCGGVSNAICLTDSSGVPVPITTNKIVVTTLTFNHYSTPSNNPVTPSVETIQISVTASNNTTNEGQKSTRTLQGSASPFNQ